MRGDECPAAKWNPEKVDDDWQIGRVRQVLHRPLAIFSVIGPSFAIWSRCPGGNQDFFPISLFLWTDFGLQFDYRNQRLQSRTDSANRCGMKLLYTNKGKSGIISKGEVFGHNDESTDIQAGPGSRFGRTDGFFLLHS